MRNKPPKNNRIYRVVWIDAKDADESWLDSGEVDRFASETVLIESYGFILSKTKNCLILAADKANDGDYGRVTKIPLGCIKEQRIL
jgi:hypothetical protein